MMKYSIKKLLTEDPNQNIKGGPYLVPRVCFDLRKSKISIVWIHTTNFLPGWCPKNLEKGENMKPKH